MVHSFWRQTFFYLPPSPSLLLTLCKTSRTLVIIYSVFVDNFAENFWKITACFTICHQIVFRLNAERVIIDDILFLFRATNSLLPQQELNHGKVVNSLTGAQQ